MVWLRKVQMRKYSLNLVIICFIGLVSYLSPLANAGLIDRGNGLIYDDVLDIPWMQDANYSQTSGYDDDGKMTWQQSMDWAGSLVYCGFDDWRLFSADPSDRNCTDKDQLGGFDDQYFGANCTKNELWHLFYNEFGLSQDDTIVQATGDVEFQLF